MNYSCNVCKMAAIAKVPAVTVEAAVAKAASKDARAKAVKVTGASVVVDRQRHNNKNVRIYVFRFTRSSVFLTSFSVLLVLNKNDFFLLFQ